MENSNAQNNLAASLQNPKTIIKIIFFVHCILSIWAIQPQPFLPIAYLYLHLVLSVLGILAIINPGNIDCLTTYIIGLLISIVMDIIFLSIYHPRAYQYYEKGSTYAAGYVNEFRFGLGMCILNLIIKPISCFILFKLSTLESMEEPYQPFVPVPGFPGYSQGGGGGYQNTDKRETSGRRDEIDQQRA